MPLLLLVVAVLVIEMYLLIAIGGELGALTTIALVFITAALGLWMLRQQSLTMLRKVSMTMVQGDAPVLEAAEGIVMLIGGILLLIPGFFTDALGFFCLLPPTRALLLRRLRKNTLAARAQRNRQGDNSHIIDGEWHEEQEPDSKRSSQHRDTLPKPRK